MTLNGTERSIAVILAALEAAVAAGDHARALQLEEEMARRLRMEAEERGTLERRVRELVERLDVDREQIVPPVKTLTLDGELSAGTPTSDGVVVPVWFGTTHAESRPSGLHRQSVRSHHLRTGRRVGTESASLRRERVVVLEATAAAQSPRQSAARHARRAAIEERRLRGHQGHRRRGPDGHAGTAGPRLHPRIPK